ncbi:MAG: Hsp20/alpha crystallin family protein [Bacillota bacterium]
MALPARVTREQSFNPIDLMQREFDSMLNRFFGGSFMAPRSTAIPLGVDIREDADHIYVEADLPGFKKDDVDISLENNTLTISAQKKKEEQKQQKGDYLLRERQYEQFTRSFTLPPGIDEQNVDAKLDNGCLFITLNKRPEAKPHKIQVS